MELARRAIDPRARHQARLRERALAHLATVRDPATRAALTPDWRGGACTMVIAPGEIAVGDEIRIEE